MLIFSRTKSRIRQFILRSESNFNKGGSVEETLVYMFSPYRKFEFSSPVTLVYLFKNCLSQFSSPWESAEPVFCSGKLGSLPCKNKTKAWLSLIWWKIQICCMLKTRTTDARWGNRLQCMVENPLSRRSIFCLPHQPKFSDFSDLCLHWVSVVRGFYEWDSIVIIILVTPM